METTKFGLGVLFNTVVWGLYYLSYQARYSIRCCSVTGTLYHSWFLVWWRKSKRMSEFPGKCTHFCMNSRSLFIMLIPLSIQPGQPSYIEPSQLANNGPATPFSDATSSTAPNLPNSDIRSEVKQSVHLSVKVLFWQDKAVVVYSVNIPTVTQTASSSTSALDWTFRTMANTSAHQVSHSALAIGSRVIQIRPK